MEKNGKVQKKKFKEEDKKSENKTQQKRGIKEKKFSEAKKIAGKKYFQKTSHHQLKRKLIPKKVAMKSNNASENDHQTMELDSDVSEEDDESEEDVSGLTARRSNKLSKAPQHVKEFFNQEAKEFESNSEDSDEEKSSFSGGEEAEELSISGNVIKIHRFESQIELHFELQLDFGLKH